MKAAWTRRSTLALVFALVFVMPFASAACDSGEKGIIEPVAGEPAAGQTAEAVESAETGEEAVGNGAARDTGPNDGGSLEDEGLTGDDIVLPPGFPSGMPLPAGTKEVTDDTPLKGYSAFYSAHVPSRHFTEVVPELEAALPASGWSIVEQKADLSWVGDRQFIVESGGVQWGVYVGLKRDTQHDTSVAYFQRE